MGKICNIKTNRLSIKSNDHANVNDWDCFAFSRINYKYFFNGMWIFSNYIAYLYPFDKRFVLARKQPEPYTKIWTLIIKSSVTIRKKNTKLICKSLPQVLKWAYFECNRPSKHRRSSVASTGASYC